MFPNYTYSILAAGTSSAASSSTEEDARLTLLQSESDKMQEVARSLFPVLVEIDGGSVSSSSVWLRSPAEYRSEHLHVSVECRSPLRVSPSDAAYHLSDDPGCTEERSGESPALW